MLEEGFAEKPSDIDVIYVHGYGWPEWTGGPMHWAERTVGLTKLQTAIVRYHQAFPNVPHWKPSALLTNLAAAAAPLEDWKKHLPAPSPAARL